MNKERAQKKARAFNALSASPAVSYAAMPIESTKWEKDRWQVAELYNGEVVGVAMC
jgi:hypothetical protein